MAILRSLKAFVFHYLRKRRKRRQTLLLESLLLLSALLFILPSQIGITYGDFTSSSDAAVTFQACGIFPEEVEALLSQVNEHIKDADTHKNQFQAFKASTTPTASFTSFNSTSDTPPISPANSLLATNTATASIPPHATATSATYHDSDKNSFDSFHQIKHESTAENTSLQITFLQESLIAVNDQLASNSYLFQKITYELESGAFLLNDIIQKIRDKSINCVKFSRSALLDEGENLLNQDNLLSPSFYTSLAGLMEYLRQVYEAGIAIQNVPNSLTNQLGDRESSYRMLNEATSDAASPELLQYYRDLQSSLEADKQAISSELLFLESCLNDIEAATGAEAGSVAHEEPVSESDSNETLKIESHMQDE
ncbi:hypothetical protein [Paenibacillus bouchesdurhonensis]|uniref:hypothetical protein n=1 Tax=Paenibacillus bouchesdurhonensis TaxID=1870990 RepID=UPI000DA62BED|nr:hypothetical protein [Paenibacillus bouchesdurhonensis]